MKFTASVAGEVTGVRFYKESGMSGQNVGHLWSSTGTLLATATFTNESSSGWQQVNFSSPVAITGQHRLHRLVLHERGLFRHHHRLFHVRRGHQRAAARPAQQRPRRRWGLNRPGDFPNGNGNGMNFWADVAFVPSSSGNIAAKASSPGSHSIAVGGFGSGTSTTDQSSRLGVLAPPATPAGPARSVAGWRGTTPTTLGFSSYRGSIPQAATLASWIKKSFFTFGSV